MKKLLAIGAMLLVLGGHGKGGRPNTGAPLGTKYRDSTGAKRFGAGFFSVIDQTAGVSFNAFCIDLKDEAGYHQTPITGTLTYGPVGDALRNGPPNGSGK